MFRLLLQIACLFVLIATPSSAADRTTFAVAMPTDAAAADAAKWDAAVFANQAMLEKPAATGMAYDAAWRAYTELWLAHAADPANRSIRRFLGLPLNGAIEIRSTRGRSAPSWLQWRRGSYQQFESPHFTIYSRASDADSQRVAVDLEQCYWVWTQMFFPLWEGNQQVSLAFADWHPDTSVADHLAKKTSRLSTRTKMKVVLFRDWNEYAATLSESIPGIERSTGFYSDENRTTFLFAGHDETEATRRHELTHQLFREATRSTRSRTSRSGSDKMPGEDAGFWLIEGIAGYFESLQLHPSHATLGGWDASRLQYARYRTLVGGDFMPLSELEPEGRLQAQQRTDLARYYAHAIAHTHQLLDGGSVDNRKWIYHRLAELYGIQTPYADVPDPITGVQPMRSFLTVNDNDLKRNPPDPATKRLCLSSCEVTADGMGSFPKLPELDWLDLSRNRQVDSDAVNSILANATLLTQLSLEATAVDNRIAGPLKNATKLEELDLSFAAIDNTLIQTISGLSELRTLWLTKTQVGDAAMDVIESLPKLEVLDVQQTNVTDARLEQFKRARPNVKLNPLELRVQ
ncbi:putative secreted protein [Rhodopirellula maiorica SM1]|uniref:Putative secreted protein n=1 Tax=Rhodopirellula maiorica SM1 TaxID=1265738 RepID=M5RNL7_9BACT|nr:putative secreted protein [Rhodopirellula maiorica]EMI20890.1 putative secreted protein [Rhodopirellula maiorica SM1]